MYREDTENHDERKLNRVHWNKVTTLTGDCNSDIIECFGNSVKIEIRKTWSIASVHSQPYKALFYEPANVIVQVLSPACVIRPLFAYLLSPSCSTPPSCHRPSCHSRHRHLSRPLPLLISQLPPSAPWVPLHDDPWSGHPRH